MASIRAEAVAEILWELKQREKLSTLSEVAGRFKPGVNGKTILNCLETVKKEWPHLQWWRAVRDDGTITEGSDLAGALTSNGYELSPVNGKDAVVEIVGFEAHVYSWTAQIPADAEAAPAVSPA
jgi:hypothetical protein